MCLAIPGQVVAITDPINALALVDVGGVKREVNVSCIIDESHPVDTCVGAWVVVHVGFAMSRIDEQEARETLALLDELAY